MDRSLLQSLRLIITVVLPTQKMYCSATHGVPIVILGIEWVKNEIGLE